MPSTSLNTKGACFMITDEYRGNLKLKALARLPLEGVTGGLCSGGSPPLPSGLAGETIPCKVSGGAANDPAASSFVARTTLLP